MLEQDRVQAGDLVDEHLVCFTCKRNSKVSQKKLELIRLRLRQEVESIQAFLNCQKVAQLTPQAFIQVMLNSNWCYSSFIAHWLHQHWPLSALWCFIDCWSLIIGRSICLLTQSTLQAPEAV